MPVDDLLYWMSARVEGTWQQFKRAVEELHLDGMHASALADGTKATALAETTSNKYIYREISWNLSALAHTEFFSAGCENGWRVVPPTLVQLSDSPQAVLCGARSLRLISALEKHEGINLSCVAQDEAPICITVSALNIDALNQLGLSIGVPVLYDAPLAMLVALPSLENYAPSVPRELPYGSEYVQHFSTKSLAWHSVSRSEALALGGLVRFQLYYERQYFFVRNGSAHLISAEVGKYLALKIHRRRVVTYDKHALSLTVPAICRPPLLLERALILCSGLLPNYNAEQKSLTYLRIREDVAQAAFSLLHQEH